MGQHMARHIYAKLDRDDNLYVYDINPLASEKFINLNEQVKGSEGLKQLSSIESFVNEVDEQLDFIVTMVPEGNHVKEISGRM